MTRHDEALDTFRQAALTMGQLPDDTAVDLVVNGRTTYTLALGTIRAVHSEPAPSEGVETDLREALVIAGNLKMNEAKLEEIDKAKDIIEALTVAINLRLDQ